MDDGKKTSMRDMYEELNKAYELMSINAPDYFREFMDLYDSTQRQGVLSEKIKELISIALAIIEVGEVAVLMGGSPSFVYIKNVLDACDEFGAK